MQEKQEKRNKEGKNNSRFSVCLPWAYSGHLRNIGDLALARKVQRFNQFSLWTDLMKAKLTGCTYAGIVSGHASSFNTYMLFWWDLCCEHHPESTCKCVCSWVKIKRELDRCLHQPKKATCREKWLICCCSVSDSRFSPFVLRWVRLIFRAWKVGLVIKTYHFHMLSLRLASFYRTMNILNPIRNLNGQWVCGLKWSEYQL